MNARRDLIAFYAVVALIALAGQALAAVEWLGWPMLPALAAVAALELGGVVLSRHALARTQLGERAIAARALSAAVALFAVAFNWLGHADHRQGGFFAGMSALGYLVWLLDSAARRRDQLRALDMLAAVPPAYGVARWIRHPVITREARALAVETPTLGLHGSVTAARDGRRRERRHAAIGELLRRKLARGKDRLHADLAIATYDLDEIAARIAAAADYDGLTALLSADLTAARVAGAAPVTAPTADTAPDNPADMPIDASDCPAPPDTTGGTTAEQRMSTPDATLAAQSLFLANPDMTVDTICRIVGRSERTVRRYLVPVGGPAVPASVPPVDPQEARLRAAEVAMFGATTQTVPAPAGGVTHHGKVHDMGIFDKDPAYQKLKALRDSGYKGPVDQDGNKVPDLKKWINERRKK